VTSGSLFVCMRGASFDGHDFAEQAVADGAVALLVDHALDGVAAAQLVVDDTRIAAGVAASATFGYPSRSLTTIGITGTNGKTTTAQLVAAIFEGAGRSTGVVGTLHGPRTTPEAPELQAVLAGFVAARRVAAVMEVSSHALHLHRVDGTAFDVVAFTNLGRDHLDLHGTQEAYFRAKARLFQRVFAPIAVINVDDPHGRVLADAVAARDGDTDAMSVISVSIDDVTEVDVEASRHRYRWRGLDVRVPIGGMVNVANSVMALSIATAAGVSEPDAVEAIASFSPIPGRFESVGRSSRNDQDDQPAPAVVVDYAHTPDGLETLLESSRRLVSGAGRVIVVFGCGGERDREKRPQMGAVAARVADVVVVTSDNPRREPPSAIIDDILDGVDDRYRARVSSEPDRRRAISQAISQATDADIVVIAGKGHETTQDLGDSIIDFDDRAVARAVLDARTASSPAEDHT
jgi:UDP-N-acetylmuramoyl-L-alanyl-D-glutamate--2,6-diaminopimelate ligase